MASIAVLHVDGLSMAVLSGNFSLRQDTDHTGKPSSPVFGGKINLEVEATEENISLVDWMINPTEKKSGKIEYFKADEEAVLKTVEFKNAYLVEYEEITGDSYGNRPPIIRLIISPTTLIVEGTVHTNRKHGFAA